MFSNNKVKTKKFDNKLSGFVELIEWLKKHEALEPHVCLEATGVYGEALATYLFENSYKVSVVNPTQVKGFAQSELARTNRLVPKDSVPKRVALLVVKPARRLSALGSA
ncbi:MAG: transposase [Gammaproteobacteria bacterium]|nr:transposase [Gammaproteobacteria bacterium]MBP9728882.1 transposase [Gammaproteobacteria bacterium]